MKLINTLTLSIALIAILGGCDQINSKHPGFDKTDSGLYYKIISNNKTEKKAKVGDIAIVHLKYGTDDSTLFDSKNMVDSLPIKVIKPPYAGSFMEGLTLMNVGDSAVFKTSADSFFTKVAHADLPDFIKTGDELTFNIKLINSESEAAMQKAQADEAKKHTAEEQSKIQSYLKENDIDATPSANGLYYIETKKGTGSAAEVGDTVEVNYIGKLLDGTVFDNSYDRGEPIQFVLGARMVIPGWDQGITKMNEGGKAKLIVPSDLAYGPQGKGQIKPYSVLVFEVSLEKVIKGTGQNVNQQPVITPPSDQNPN